ncbi:phosphonate transport system substrate-binding protein [Mycoplasmopsis mustelae]|uniref:Phosphonate transport system substrate-binding protein n=1 Tax=Mycoplasmopsis mustelae TaxID=171289 RepID=A0A4R7UE98_9BACT|nr:PhnD/SsuA/transferrin family substrate-binding protein [Mycoplasmopsis mustelae]TDV24173.1 phosphonate transport system substrate-binding protein [Mycoplasmopsis mustelae]
MKFKKLLTTSIISVTALSFAITVSCAQQNRNRNIIKLNLTSPYDLSPNEISNLKVDFENKLNTQLVTQGSKLKVKINFKSTDDYVINADEIKKDVADVAFVSAGSLLTKKTDILNAGLKIKLQTLTKQFNGDIEYDFNSQQSKGGYSDGSENDDLRKIAKAENDLFHRIPRDKWDDTTAGNKWNGSIYEAFYNESLVPYQRGAIILVGTDQQITEIKDAWDKKDLKKFIKFGIVFGDTDSGSKYILPEALLKKHFGSEFTSLAKLATSNNYKNSFVKGKLKQMNEPNFSNKHIFFDNEGSYAYTKFKANKDAFEVKRKNEKIEIFSVTDVLPYNVGLFNSNLSDESIKQLSNALIALSTKKNDPWGPKVGFNSYRIIQNAETEFWRVIKNTIGK